MTDFSITAAAEFAGVSRQTIYDLLTSGTLTATGPEHRRKIAQSDLEQWLKSRANRAYEVNGMSTLHLPISDSDERVKRIREAIHSRYRVEILERVSNVLESGVKPEELITVLQGMVDSSDILEAENA